jgi:putative mRNA 3-end processing factor
MIIAPPAVEDSSWTKKFRKIKRGFASGWMAIRGPRRRKNIDRGFVLSDHADWNGLIDVITGTGAEVVKVTHGNGDALSRYLKECGINGSVLEYGLFQSEEME